MTEFCLIIVCVCVRWATGRPTGPIAEQPVCDERGRPADHGRGHGQSAAECPGLDQHLPAVQRHVHHLKEVRYNSVTSTRPPLTVSPAHHTALQFEGTGGPHSTHQIG